MNHEAHIRMPGHARQMGSSALQIDHEQNVVCRQARPSPDFRGEEVDGSDVSPVGLQERPPGGGTFWGGPDPILLEDRGDRRSGHTVSQPLQFALDTALAPSRVGGRHLHDQPLDLPENAWAPSPPGLKRPLQGDQL